MVNCFCLGFLAVVELLTDGKTEEEIADTAGNKLLKEAVLAEEENGGVVDIIDGSKDLETETTGRGEEVYTMFIEEGGVKVGAAGFSVIGNSSTEVRGGYKVVDGVK